MSQPVAIVIEDEPQIRRFVRGALESEGWLVHEAGTLRDGLAAAGTRQPDLLVLDLGLPDGDGIDWLRRLRQEGRTLPVIIMTARDALPDRVAGLDQGADDYLVKPFAPEELLARMRVALRRSEGRASPLLHHGDLEVDPAAHTVRKAGTLVPLRAKEFALLLALLRASGQVLSRQRLEEALYGFDDALESNALEVHIHHLRRKLGSELLQTVRGVGYFVPRPDTGQAGGGATHSVPP